MTQTMIDGLAEPQGIGCFQAAGETHFLPCSGAELERAEQFVKRILSSFHFRTGKDMLVISLLDAFVQFQPVERAAMDYGLIVCSADDSAFDAARVESIMRRFDVSAVAALSNGVLDGLEQLGHDPRDLFGDTVVWAYPDACERLAGCDVHQFARLGPAIGMECPEKNGLHLDHMEWEVTSVDGEICLSSKLMRAVDFAAFCTGTRGEVEYAVCGCGNADPRVRLS